jgi:hypothetical protein
MFSLIITLISIALVAALALATLYYGGPAFNKGYEAAHASQLINQGQHLAGANELYKADNGSYAASLQDLVAGNYLKEIPTALAPSMASYAFAADAGWNLVTPGVNVFAYPQTASAVCAQVNAKMYGQAGILKSARSGLFAQCYGTDSANLTVLVGGTAQELHAAAAAQSPSVPLGALLSTPIPEAASTDTSASGWLMAPGSTVISTGGSTGGSTSGSTGGPTVTDGPAITYTNATVLTALNVPFRNNYGFDQLVLVAPGTSFTVTNTGTAPIDTGGGSVYNLGWSSADCSSPLIAPGQSCTYTVLPLNSFLTASNGTAIDYGFTVNGIPWSYELWTNFVVDTGSKTVTPALVTGATVTLLNIPGNVYANGNDDFHAARPTSGIVDMENANDFPVDYYDAGVQQVCNAHTTCQVPIADIGPNNRSYIVIFPHGGSQGVTVKFPPN